MGINRLEGFSCGLRRVKGVGKVFVSTRDRFRSKTGGMSDCGKVELVGCSRLCGFVGNRGDGCLIPSCGAVNSPF